jgi:hypothetical protein
MVDNFGFKYTKRCNANHLLAALQEIYVITMDWIGSLYLTMTIGWDYIKKTIDISMPGYVAKALGRFQHNTIRQPQHSPHAWTKPHYGSHPQLTPQPDDTSLLRPTPPYSPHHP